VSWARAVRGGEIDELFAVVAAHAPTQGAEPQVPSLVLQNGKYHVMGQAIRGGEGEELSPVVAAHAPTQGAEPQVPAAIPEERDNGRGRQAVADPETQPDTLAETRAGPGAIDTPVIGKGLPHAEVPCQGAQCLLPLGVLLQNGPFDGDLGRLFQGKELAEDPGAAGPGSLVRFCQAKGLNQGQKFFLVHLLELREALGPHPQGEAGQGGGRGNRQSHRLSPPGSGAAQRRAWLFSGFDGRRRFL